MISNNITVVLHVVEAMGGGVYSYFTDLSHVLGQDSRVKLVIAYSNKRDEIDPEKVIQDFHPKVELVLLDLKKEISLLSDYNGVKQIQSVIKKVQPDVIHLHSSKAGILGKIAVVASKFKKPTYYTPHGYSFLRQDISPLKRLIFKTIESIFARFTTTTTVACGDTELQYAKKLHSNAVLIRNGINPKEVPFIKKHQSVASTTIGTLGRVSFPKNPPKFNRLAKLHPGHQFLWIGSGELKQELTSTNIVITGWFPQKAKAIPHLEKLDVYLQTSLWEGLPIAVIEAMAMGLPVIATNVIGNKDLVIHGETGFLIEDESDFGIYMEKLNDVSLRNSMGLAARARIEEYFDCTKNFTALVDLYLSDLANNSPQKG